MYDENDWLNFRAEARAFMKEKEETLVKKWLDEIGYKYKEPVGYHRNSWKKEMEIYSTRVGHLIGKAGVNVDKLEKMLSEEFKGNWKVKFFEIRGGFVNM